MKVAAVIFTYAPDLPLAALSARSWQRMGVPCTLALDRHDVRVACDGVPLLRTDFPRSGNLNGIACALGILRTLKEQGAGSDWVIKCDSDTIAHRMQWLDVPAQAGLVGMDYKGARFVYGACYAIRMSRIDELMEAVAAAGDVHSRAEDQMMGYAARKLGMLHAYPLMRDKQPMAFHPWGRNLTPEQLLAWDVMSFQPTRAIRAAANFRVKVLARMRDFYTAAWGGD